MTTPEETLTARFAAVDKAIALLGHLYTAHLVTKALRRLGHLSIVAPETDAFGVAGLVVIGPDQREMVFYVGGGGWSAPHLAATPDENPFKHLPVSTPPDVVAKHIADTVFGTAPDAQR